MDERSPDTLKTYRDKRKFDITPEPAAGGVPNEQARAFVIQKHWATRLHYDFRLELEGTMKSWAVPKGPSYDPADKRMAMHVEDHPLSYNSFEGTIPPGNYGAGKVIIWDKGVWIPLEDPHKGYRDGKQDPWLLIKEKDDFVRPSTEFSVVDEMPDSVKKLPDRPAATAPRGARAPAPSAPAANGPPQGARKAPLPAHLQPQLATLVDELPKDPDNWIYEIKFDGYRMLARAERGKIALFTRNGNDWTHKLPQLAEA